MGILNSVSRFFSSLFSGGAHAPKPLELSADEIDDWLSQTSADETKRLVEHALSRFSEIRFLVKELKAGFSRLAAESVEQDTGNPALRKVVSSSKQSIAERLNRLVEKLEPPRSAEFSTISTYCLNSYSLLQKEILSMRKEIAYTGILLSGTVKGLGPHFGELEQILSALQQEFSKSPVTGRLSHVHQHRETIRNLSEKNKELSANLASNRSEQLSLENEIQRHHDTLNTEQGSETALRLGELKLLLEQHNQKQFKLEQSLAVLLEPVDKPLRRLHQIVEAKTASNNALALSPELAQYLSTLMRSPASAFKSDPKGALFKRLLLELKQAIASEVVTLKDKEKEKCISAIYFLSEYDFFEHFFWKHNQSEVEKQKIEKELKSSVYFMNIQNIETDLSRLEGKKTLLGHDRAGYAAALEKNRAEIEQEKQTLEQQLAQIHGAAVTIRQ
ncbi:MAG: hypothetical protein Q7R47_02445 [Candidatus Diapherotrites archaeon]|nr:hypothetical protein [Candidatus Diapherotrites archaeon]